VLAGRQNSRCITCNDPPSSDLSWSSFSLTSSLHVWVWHLAPLANPVRDDSQVFISVDDGIGFLFHHILDHQLMYPWSMNKSMKQLNYQTHYLIYVHNNLKMNIHRKTHYLIMYTKNLDTVVACVFRVSSIDFGVFIFCGNCVDSCLTNLSDKLFING
jgi:hypothetical protein